MSNAFAEFLASDECDADDHFWIRVINSTFERLEYMDYPYLREASLSTNSKIHEYRKENMRHMLYSIVGHSNAYYVVSIGQNGSKYIYKLIKKVNDEPIDIEQLKSQFLSGRFEISEREYTVIVKS